MIKVYIAGAVKGLPQNLVKEKFATAAKLITQQGNLPVNPVEIIETVNVSRAARSMDILVDENEDDRKAILKICIYHLMECEAIYLLHDWQQSSGATFEKQVADFFKIPIIHV